MKPEMHEKLDAICIEICDKICHWPRMIKCQEDLDNKCAACQPLVDLVNLIESLEAMIPPEKGEKVWVIALDCEHREKDPGDCDRCKAYAVCAEPFSASDHLEDWYNGKVYRTEVSAQAALKEKTGPDCNQEPANEKN
jgi:hypothetical protein